MNERTIFRSPRRCVQALAVAVLLCGFAGCGQRGPLTLPGKHARRTPAAQQQNQTENGEDTKKKKKNESDASEDGR